jgi:hypothetical protein
VEAAGDEAEEDEQEEAAAAGQQLELQELQEETVETFSTWAEVEVARLKARYEGTFGYPPRGSRTNSVAWLQEQIGYYSG